MWTTAFKGAGWVLSKVFSTTGLLAGGAAYLYDKGQDKEENKIGAEKLVEGALVPIAKNLGSTMLKGAQNIATGVAENVGAQGAIKTAATATETGLTTLPGMAATAIPQAAGAVGGAVSSGVEVGQNTVGSFVDKLNFIPEGLRGVVKWGAMAAATVLGGFGLSKAIGFTTGEALFSKALSLPMNALTGAGGLALQVATPFLYIGGALTLGWLVLTENGRGVISSVFEGVKSLASGSNKTPAAEHGAEHAPTPAPAVAPAPAAPAPMPSVSGLNLDGITGGTSTHTVSLNRDQLPANPRLNAAESHLGTVA